MGKHVRSMVRLSSISPKVSAEHLFSWDSWHCPFMSDNNLIWVQNSVLLTDLGWDDVVWGGVLLLPGRELPGLVAQSRSLQHIQVMDWIFFNSYEIPTYIKKTKTACQIWLNTSSANKTQKWVWPALWIQIHWFCPGSGSETKVM